MAKVADGGMRDAQSMLDQLVSFCGDHIEEQQVLHIFGITSRETVAQALALILKKELPSLLHLLHEQAEAGRDMGQFLSEIISAVREILVAKVDPEANFDSLPEASKEELTELVKRTQTDKILRLVEVLAETEDKMRWSTNKKTASGNGPDQSRSRPGGSKHQRYYHGAGRCSATRLHKYGCSSIRLFRSAGIRPAHSAGPLLILRLPYLRPPTSMRARTLWIRFRNSPHPARTQQPSSRNVKRNTERRLRGRKPSASPVLPSPEPEPEVSATAAEEEPLPSIPDEEPPFLETETPPAPAPQPEQIQPEEMPRITSALSDAPVAPPDTTEPTFMDPEEGLPPEKRTSSFFDNLFGMESAPARPVSANQEEKREEQPRPATKTITEEDWKAALEQAAVNFPLQADFLAGSVFSGHDGTFVTVAFHPSDRQGMDSLASGPLRAALEADLSRRSGAPVALSVRADASVPEPVQEQLEPLPAPPPVKPGARAQIPGTAKKVRCSRSRGVLSGERRRRLYYTDPLIDAAMEIFRARIISQ